jgi:glycosyltransferase involved in cell wall biosynthesis
MKILLASSSSGSRGGGELYLLYLGRALAERGHEPMLWASTHPRMDELADGFARFGAVHRGAYTNTYDRPLRSLASYADRASARCVADSWRTTGAEFIHLNKQNLEDGLDLLAAARLTDAPSLCTIHLTQSARYLRAVFAPLRDAVARRALARYPGLLVTVLEQRRHDLADFVGPAPRLRMIPNGVPLFDLTQRARLRVEQRTTLGFATEEKVIIAVGRLVPQKQPLAFLEQARLISAAHPQARFVWVGDGALAGEWDARVRELGLSRVVQRLPWQSDVLPLLFAADVFLHVAEFEGLPLAILEAMSAGLPCAIAAHLLAEMPFFGPHDVLPVSPDAAWATALEDPARLATLGQRARRLVEESFSFASMAGSYEALYRETLGHRQLFPR